MSAKKNTILDFFMSFISGKMIQDLNTKKSIKVASLLLVYGVIIVGNTYYGQKQVSEIEILKKNLSNLKYKQSIYRSDLMDISKQSSISKALKEDGIVVSKTIPQKITVKKQSHE